MILGGALITQYKTKEEAEPARFKNFQNRFHRKLTGSVEYRGVVPEEDDSVSFYGERSQTIFMVSAASFNHLRLGDVRGFGGLLTLADYRDSILSVCAFLCFNKWKKHEMSSAPPRIVELVETFDLNIEAYHSQQYNETQLRREFIDPFFEELGWDMTNKAGRARSIERSSTKTP